MKKIFALLLALTLVFSLAACGGKTDDSNTNEESIPSSDSNSVSNAQATKSNAGGFEVTNLKVDSISYNDGVLSLDAVVEWNGVPKDNAWIGIVPADVPHGSEEKNDEFDTDYFYFDGKASGDTFSFKNDYLEPGEYTLRINESDDGGAELAWIGFKFTSLGRASADDAWQKVEKPEAMSAVFDGSKLGVLQPVAKQDKFVIDGLYLTSESGQHEYAHIDDVEALGVDNLNSEYELNEWIDFYIDAELDSSMSVYLVRNDSETDYSKLSESELAGICEEKGYPSLVRVTPDAENRGYIGQVYVHPESSEPALFNAFFVSDGVVCYMVQLNIIAESAAE